jgi:hypothetical protein
MRKRADKAIERLAEFSDGKHLGDFCLSMGHRLAGQGLLTARFVANGVSNWRIARFAQMTLTFLMKHGLHLGHSCLRASGYSRFIFGRLDFFPMLSCGLAEQKETAQGQESWRRWFSETNRAPNLRVCVTSVGQEDRRRRRDLRVVTPV